MSIKLIVFDIDETLIDNASGSNDFYQRWMNIRFKEAPLLCYNSGRLPDDLQSLIKSKLIPKPDFFIAGVGTSIYDYRKSITIKEFSQVLDEGWNLTKVQQVMEGLGNQISKQPEHFQNDFKSSWFYDNATEDDLLKIKKLLKKADLEVNVVYSSSRHLDILPKWANKGNSLEWLLDYLDISTEETIVAGDSGNDSAMFKIPHINGIVVGNAQPELYHETKGLSVFYSEKPRYEAVFEGLRHYGLEWDTVAPEEKKTLVDILDLDSISLMEERELVGITKSQLKTIRTGYEKAVEAIKKNITPIGFSACSLSDNESVGTDENYRSVWARDGSIAITGTIYLTHDKEIVDCQRNTLDTLLRNISINGQVPSNVRINDGLPDYSGVGGICSIDSGLWLIIAFHDFIKVSKDMEFLREHFASLLRIMDWLSAQDGNNDALLEIPEAGDWTDLFGRSYNILYDEVLWYRANVCFGRLLEMLGNYEKAGDYLRWSQVIKREILLNFWPTTKNKLYHSTTFAEQQYSLGDARYLIAQVTPFDFSWRCDVYGNVLAYLYDVIDKEKATSAFRFMWGSGVNDPYPVENVYPAVNAGDPDWRPYYTVNLLNLPHHYHNGGIWPFIGGGWVSFINKLGVRELALKELFNLAKLNRLGSFNEWEFNEWAHGKTGRPMGKAFQAWSASEYILACHELKIINQNNIK
jgi:sucrose-6F-phosphate phosphohydrolase